MGEDGKAAKAFVVVVDVGQVIELYAEFTRTGATYTPFPDARSHRPPPLARTPAHHPAHPGSPGPCAPH
jgi:hypothetical protein